MRPSHGLPLPGMTRCRARPAARREMHRAAGPLYRDPYWHWKGGGGICPTVRLISEPWDSTVPPGGD
jgi:hypothetical protein